MKLILAEDEFNFYIFTPTLFRQYYNKNEDWTFHRKLLTHKLHMLLYYIRNKYNILYMMKENQIVSYLIYTRCSKTIIKGSTSKDYFTIFITTNPQFRGKGYAKQLLDVFLNKFNFKYETSYKIIQKSNLASQKVAFLSGYREICNVSKTKFLKTIVESDTDDFKLYAFSKGKRNV